MNSNDYDDENDIGKNDTVLEWMVVLNPDVTNSRSECDIQQEKCEALMDGLTKTPNDVIGLIGVILKKIPDENWDYCYGKK
jgi:hypothetical protein